jgi:CrcB protein
MQKLLIVGLGGFLGTIARYGLGHFVVQLKGATAFPFHTLLVNVLGCLVIGFLGGLTTTRPPLSENLRAFLFIGVLGGFTTFSSFGYETFQLFRDDRADAAFLSMGLQLFLGLGGVWAGVAVARAV